MAGGMGGLHVREGDDRTVHYYAPATPRRPAPTPRLSERERERRRQQLEQDAADAYEYARSPVLAGVLDDLARDLGVPRRTLDALGCGWWQLASGHEGYTWPVYDGDRRACGVATRSPEGGKAMLSGSRPGLYLQRNPDLTGTVPWYLPEGATDKAVLLALGLEGAGRFSCCGGAEDLAQLLRDYRGPILLIADNDPKPDGTWPGLDGARRLARQLRQLLGREVQIVLPPDGSKDIRTWLNAQQPDLTDAEALRRLGWALEEQLWANVLSVEQADAMLAIAASDGASEAASLPLTDTGLLVRQAMAQAAEPVEERYVDPRPSTYGGLGLADRAIERCHHCHGVHMAHRIDSRGRKLIWLRCKRNTCPGCWTRNRRLDIEHATECINRSYALGRPVRVLEGLSEAEHRRVTGQVRDDPDRLRVLADDGSITLYTPADLGPGIGQELETADDTVRHIAATIHALTADESRRQRVRFSGEWKRDRSPRQWQRLSAVPYDAPTTRQILDAHGITQVLESRPRRGGDAIRLSLTYSIPATWTPQQIAALDADLAGAAAKTLSERCRYPYASDFAPPGHQDEPPDDWAFWAPAEPPD